MVRELVLVSSRYKLLVARISSGICKFLDIIFHEMRSLKIYLINIQPTALTRPAN
ncbi:MAG: hypothetical protein QNJ38_21060 [Prochloraceae cyanobacterium]|nr:hypothetical protein [Prochloraceae cyanobacterium]